MLRVPSTVAKGLLSIALVLGILGPAWAGSLRVVCFNVQNGLYASSTSSYQDTVAILRRLDADVVGLCELMVYDPNRRTWVLDEINFPELASELGLPYRAIDPAPGTHFNAIASRYPIEEVFWVNGQAMTRRIPLVRIAVPSTEQRIWVAMLHLKARHTSALDQHIRAAELYYLRQAVRTHCDTRNDLVVLMGDFNLVSPGNDDFTEPRYSDVQYPLSAPRDADGYFVAESIFKLDARHVGPGGESWTWRSDGIFPDGALDHVMVNEPVRQLGVAAEVYDVQKDAAGLGGLAKYGPPPLPGASYGSDHLPVFADLNLPDAPGTPARLSVDMTNSLDSEGPAGGPFVPEDGFYILRNTGSAPLEWAVEWDALWMTLSPSSGTIQPGSHVTVRASFADGAATLPAGRQGAIINFVNRTNGLGNAEARASVLVGAFVMDGMADAPGYKLIETDLGLHVAVRGTRLYVATMAPAATGPANDHHILISDRLLESASTPAPWAKRGRHAAPDGHPFLAAEGSNTWAGWFNAPAGARLLRPVSGAGVLEGSLDLVAAFGAVPEHIYVAVVEYETNDAAAGNPQAGRVVGQVPAAVTPDDDIGPEEFLQIPLRSIADSAADGRYDIDVPGRGLAAWLQRGGSGSLEMRWPSAPRRIYRVWRTRELRSPAWEPVTEMHAGVRDWEMSWTAPEADSAHGLSFYKVELLPTELNTKLRRAHAAEQR